MQHAVRTFAIFFYYNNHLPIYNFICRARHNFLLIFHQVIIHECLNHFDELHCPLSETVMGLDLSREVDLKHYNQKLSTRAILYRKSCGEKFQTKFVVEWRVCFYCNLHLIKFEEDKIFGYQN